MSTSEPVPSGSSGFHTATPSPEHLLAESDNPPSSNRQVIPAASASAAEAMIATPPLPPVKLTIRFDTEDQTPARAIKRSGEPLSEPLLKKRGRSSNASIEGSHAATHDHGDTFAAIDISQTPVSVQTVDTNTCIAENDLEATALTARETAKRKAIAARNGAPMGWAFVDPSTKPGSRLVSAVEQNLPRSARRARASLVREEANNISFGHELEREIVV